MGLNIVLIIPTGVGAEIGGHAGDGNPVAKLLASCCDILITHPNVVNASDINEMTENTWYVEGSMLDRFLRGEINLKQPLNNKILVVVNKPVSYQTINAVSAARVTIGIDAEILELETPLIMIATIENNKASGIVEGWKELGEQVGRYNFDALAIATPVSVEKEVARTYLKYGGINPWGGVEAKASKLIAANINKPVAHAPFGETLDINEWKFVADPRMAPEFISECYLHCVLKGLHRAPRINNNGLSIENIDFLISPIGVWGVPHKACVAANIPVLLIKENKTCLNEVASNCIIVENYWEAAGYIMSRKAGILPSSVRRPISKTKVLL